jgi:F-box/leucine-rich repeat protein 2/20
MGRLRDDAIMLLTGACRWLKRLGIAECSGLTSECLGAVSYANGLTDLDLSLNDFVTDEGLAQIAGKVTGLTTLDISGCGLITDEGVNPIARLRNITALDLSGNMLVSDPAIIAIAEGCPRLASLKCMMMPALTSKPVQMLGAKCAELRVLDLSYVALLSDIGLRTVVRCCKGLVDLNLAWCESLSQGSFQYIAQFCRALERLNVSTTAVGDAEALAILDQCRSLLEISLVDCRRLSVKGLEAVLANAACDSRFSPVNVLTGRPDSTQRRGVS